MSRSYFQRVMGLPALREVLATVREGGDARVAVARGFGGSGSWGDFERAWKQFMQGLHYKVLPGMEPVVRKYKRKGRGGGAPRPGDIPLLVDHFVSKYAQSAGKRMRGADPAAIGLLSGYPWPGNVRELENVIERGMILARSDVLGASDLDFGRRHTPPLGAVASPGLGSAAGADNGRSLHKRLQDQERAEIVAAVEQAQGNIAHAARTLGINRSTLYYRMRKHGLEHLLPTRDEPPESAPTAVE